MMLRVEILKLPLGKTGGERKRAWNLELEWGSNLSSSKNGLKLFDFSELQLLSLSKKIVFVCSTRLLWYLTNNKYTAKESC